MYYEASLSVNPEAAVPANLPDTSNTSGTDQTDTTYNMSASPSDTPATPTEPQYLQDLRAAFADAIANPDFTGDKKKVEKATAALTLPDPEKRVRAQLRSNAEKTLLAAAAKEAMKTGNSIVPPRTDQIDAKVEEGVKAWREKQDR